jgi:hypothetical protein
MRTIETVLAILAGLVVVGTLIDLIARGGKGIRGLYRRTFGRTRVTYDLLARLTTEVQIAYFYEILGPASLRNTGEAHDEFVFIAKDFYVQVIATKEGRVDLYAVTARNQGFRPAVWGQTVYWSTDNNSSGLRLGDFTLTDFHMKQPPDGVMGWLGARRFHWAECYHFGNPGLYRTYALAVNDAGWMEPLQVDLLGAIPASRLALGFFAPDSQSSQEEVQDYVSRSDVATFRSTARPNTYAVLGPHLHFGDISIERMGVDLDQVRTIPR